MPHDAPNLPPDPQGENAGEHEEEREQQNHHLRHKNHDHAQSDQDNTLHRKIPQQTVNGVFDFFEKAKFFHILFVIPSVARDLEILQPMTIGFRMTQ